MTSSNGNIFRVTGPLCGEFTGHLWIPGTETSDAELWCYLWSAPWINGWVNNCEAGDLRCQRAHCNVIVMLVLLCSSHFIQILVLTQNFMSLVLRSHLYMYKPVQCINSMWMPLFLVVSDNSCSPAKAFFFYSYPTLNKLYLNLTLSYLIFAWYDWKLYFKIRTKHPGAIELITNWRRYHVTYCIRSLSIPQVRDVKYYRISTSIWRP